MKSLIIVGASGYAKELIVLGEELGYEIIGLLDDDEQKQNTCLYRGASVLGKIDDWLDYQSASFVIAIGDPRIRRKVVGRMERSGAPDFVSLISPRVYLSDGITVGKGSVIMDGAVFTADIRLGEHCIVNLGSTIAHECSLSDYATLAAQVALSGNVTVGYCAEIGAGAAIRQGLTIQHGAMLGMGAVLTRDLPANQVYVGNPARPFKELKPVED